MFFDNCTSPILASTLDGFISHSGHHAFHINDVPGLAKGRHASDPEWIERLQADEIVWIFVTGDGRVLRERPIRQALRNSGLHGFVLSPAYQKTPIHQVAANLVWRWPELEQLVRLTAPPAMFEIPISKNGRLKQLPL